METSALMRFFLKIWKFPACHIPYSFTRGQTAVWKSTMDPQQQNWHGTVGLKIKGKTIDLANLEFIWPQPSQYHQSAMVMFCVRGIRFLFLPYFFLKKLWTCRLQFFSQNHPTKGILLWPNSRWWFQIFWTFSPRRLGFHDPNGPAHTFQMAGKKHTT